MANPADIARAEQGKDLWNAWASAENAAGRSRDVDFSGHKFDVADFKGFLFPSQTSFAHAVFRGDADFHGATFSSDARFNEATFCRNASFAGTTFNGDASFTKTSFAWGAWITDVTFSGQAWFLDAVFAGDVDVAETVFSSDARFSGAKFLGNAWFYDVTFSRGAWFTGAAFAGDVRFGRAKFTGGVDEFSDAQFDGVPDFRTSRFDVPPTFQRATFHYVTSDRVGLWRRLLKCAADNSYAPAYRRLKQISADAKDHERELHFFALEMRAKRFYETSGFWPLTLNVAYDWLSEYGRSVARPLGWLAALVALAIVIVLYGHWSAAADASITFEAVVVVAVTNSALLLGADKWLLRAEAIDRLCTSCQGKFGLVTDSLFYTQSALSLFLLFLIGLALRNRFRIGGSA